jgi:ABC-2 type transport system ATP-binding protein
LPELADTCNKVGIISQGQLEHNAEVAEVLRRVRPQIVLIVQVAKPEDVARTVKLLEMDAHVESVEDERGRLRVTLKPNMEDYSTIATNLVQQGIGLKHFGEEETNLESAFMMLTRSTGDKI